MRIIVAILAVLAAGKVIYHEYLFRSAASDIIVAAYRDRAIRACRQRAGGTEPVSAAPLEASPDIRLGIGNPRVDVSLWDTDNALWNARYANPYLFVTSKTGARAVVCEYDVVHDRAAVGAL